MASNSKTAFAKRIGQIIRELRTENGWSQSELGEKIGFTYQQVQKYETGVNMPSFWLVTELARIFEVPLVRFVDNKHYVQPQRQFENRRLVNAFNHLKSAEMREAIIKLLYELAKAEGRRG